MEILYFITWLIHLCDGSLVDARTWGKKEADPKWLGENYDIIWLGYFTVGAPLMFSVIGCLITLSILGVEWWGFFSGHSLELLMAVVKNLLIAFGLSVFWDLIFCKIENGHWVTPIPLWLILPNPFRKGTHQQTRIIIGFNTVRSMTVFNVVRGIVLVVGIVM